MEGKQSDWQPLESNAEVITEYSEKLGFDATIFKFQDLLSLEEWAQAMIPEPCLGLLFIFPISAASKNKNEEEESNIQDDKPPEQKPFFIKQFAQNACGTIALLHILSNIDEDYQNLIKKDSILYNFLTEGKKMTPEERGRYFETHQEFREEHTQAVNQGQTNVKNFL